MLEAVVGVAAFATLAYALLGGADFGGGVWDLLAFGSRKHAQRRAIEQGRKTFVHLLRRKA